MVRTSERQLVITTLLSSIKQDLAVMAVDMLLEDSSSEDGWDSELQQEKQDESDALMHSLELKAQALLAIQSHRYMRPREPVERAPDYGDFLLHCLVEKRFKLHFRMTRSSFFKLTEEISGNAVFQNDSNHPQRPVHEQLMVTLKRLGCNGNGVSVGALATFFRIGEGTVELYTDRCMMAILTLRPQLLEWPTAEAREEIQRGFGDVGFKDCVGLVDGTLAVLSTCPQLDGPDYYNRKGHYGIVTLLICDQAKNITFVSTGWHGCSHDQRLMTNCCLTSSSKDYFSEGQYLLADSAFTPTTTVVPAFKKSKNRVLTEEEHSFNRHLAGVRVAIEN
jgi:hypothetical protein